MSAHDIAALRSALLSWYDSAKRDLPWRHRAHDPYAVWVSEVMLQQTRVDTVLPYYERFMARFPTTHDLAAATEDEVLAAFSGLGYYRRARLLHRGVQEVVSRYGGAVPADPRARLDLPGVGRYTAGALGSVCFGLEEPIVDGNVTRILTRIFGITSATTEPATQRSLWERAQALVVGERPGDFNQAMMELGALVCSVKQPQCEVCPARTMCVAREQGMTQQLPCIPRKAPPRRMSLVAVVARRGERVAMLRSDEELFGGLYGLPTAERDDDAAAAAAGALQRAGVQARLNPAPIGEVQHVLSHRRLHVQVFVATHAHVAEGSRARLMGVDGNGVVNEADIGVARLTHKLLALSAADHATSAAPTPGRRSPRPRGRTRAAQ